MSTDESHAISPSKSPLLERVISGLSVVSAGVPIVGGPPSVALGLWVQSMQQKRWQAYWEEVELRVASLEADGIDDSFFGTEEFVSRIQQIYREVVSDADKEKISYLRDYLIASAWENGPDASWKDIFWDHIIRLTGSHLAVLEFFFTVQKRLSLAERFQLPRATERSPITLERLSQQFPGFEERLLLVLASDLEGLALVRTWSADDILQPSWAISDTGLHLMSFLHLQWAQ